MSSNPIIIFDGVCNLCNGLVVFILKYDKKENFRFAWNQSDAGKELMRKYSVDLTGQGFILLILNDRVYKRSDAALLILKELGGFWKLFYVFRVFPRFIRDGIYNFIAANRYRWFGKKNECELPEEKYRKRFIL